MELMQQFHFLRPLWLLALPVLWATVLWLARRRARDGGWAGLVDPDLLPGLRLDGGEKPGGSPWPWLALAWTLAVLALAGPSWQRQPAPAFRASDAWVMVLDLSPSMNAADVDPNRITRARYALDDLLSAAQDARVGLVVFGAESFTVTPMTDDVATIRSLLPPLNPGIMPTPGDNLAPALVRAGKLLRQSGVRHGRVVVLSDGFDDPAAAFAAAQKLRSHGVDVDVVGIGTPSGAPVDRSGGGFARNAQGKPVVARLETGRLQQLAASGGGQYTGLTNLPGLIAGLQTGADRVSAAKPKQLVRVARWQDGGVWLLPLLLLIAAVLARRGWL